MRYRHSSAAPATRLQVFSIVISFNIAGRIHIDSVLFNALAHGIKRSFSRSSTAICNIFICENRVGKNRRFEIWVKAITTHIQYEITVTKIFPSNFIATITHLTTSMARKGIKCISISIQTTKETEQKNASGKSDAMLVHSTPHIMSQWTGILKKITCNQNEYL